MTTKKPKGEKDASKGGRPTDYKPEYDRIVEGLCKLGATEPEIAEALGVCLTTVKNWKNANDGFVAAIKRGKEFADMNVAESLFKRAVGYKAKKVVTASFQGKITDETEIDEEVAPDVTAQIFWLKNRRPDLWRSNRDADDTGKQEAQPVSITVEVKDARKDAES